jgi:hypothetical protein
MPFNGSRCAAIAWCHGCNFRLKIAAQNSQKPWRLTKANVFGSLGSCMREISMMMIGSWKSLPCQKYMFGCILTNNNSWQKLK